MAPLWLPPFTEFQQQEVNLVNSRDRGMDHYVPCVKFEIGMGASPLLSFTMTHAQATDMAARTLFLVESDRHPYLNVHTERFPKLRARYVNCWHPNPPAEK